MAVVIEVEETVVVVEVIVLLVNCATNMDMAHSIVGIALMRILFNHHLLPLIRLLIQ